MFATELRKNLFQSLDTAAKGQPILIEYKGVSFRLEALTGNSKLAAAVRRNTIVGDPQAIVPSDNELMASLEAKWAVEDKKL